MADISDLEFETYHFGEHSERLGIITYPLGPESRELFSVEDFGWSIGVHWSTNLTAQAMHETVLPLLPTTPEITIDHWKGSNCEYEQLGGDGIDKITDELAENEVFKVFYKIEPSELCREGLLVAWEAWHPDNPPPYKFSVRNHPSDLETPARFIEATATDSIKNSPGLLNIALKAIDL